MKTLREFRDGLADLKPKTDVVGNETDLTGELIDILRGKADVFRQIFAGALGSGRYPEMADDLKKLMGMVINLKDGPQERKQKNDPLSNVVDKPFANPDGASGDGHG